MDAGIGALSASPGVARASTVPDAGRRVDDAPAVAPVVEAPPPFRSSERSTAVDAATGAFVYRILDVASGAVLTQTPNEGRLRLRAYIDSLQLSKTPPELELTA